MMYIIYTAQMIVSNMYNYIDSLHDTIHIVIVSLFVTKINDKHILTWLLGQ